MDDIPEPDKGQVVEPSVDIETQEILFCLKPDDGIFQDIFKVNGIPSPFSSYNIKTKLKVKAMHLIEKLLAKIRQVESKPPDGEKIKAMNINQKDIKLYFYCSNGSRWWFESRQKISDMIEASKWPRSSISNNLSPEEKN